MRLDQEAGAAQRAGTLLDEGEAAARAVRRDDAIELAREVMKAAEEVPAGLGSAVLRSDAGKALIADAEAAHDRSGTLLEATKGRLNACLSSKFECYSQCKEQLRSAPEPENGEGDSDDGDGDAPSTGATPAAAPHALSPEVAELAYNIARLIKLHRSSTMETGEEGVQDDERRPPNWQPVFQAYTCSVVASHRSGGYLVLDVWAEKVWTDCDARL